MHEKTFRDPVHDFIVVRDPLILRLIDTPELQRLRRLRQLGTAAGTYHGAEHSRFGHSLGAMHIMGKVLARLRQTAPFAIDEGTERLARVAALLHDIGHGPLSHGLERVLTPHRSHEQWTQAILDGPTRVHDVLEKYSPGMARQVGALLGGARPPGEMWLQHMVASQLDVDRMDYLLRDALYTGAFYGRFDLERLINTLTVVDHQVVFTYKGLPTAEEYVLARHYMYWQVYFHKTTRSQDLVLRSAWRRATELAAAGDLAPPDDLPPSLAPFAAGKPVDLDAFLSVDDYDVLYALKRWMGHHDPVLSDLSSRFVHRRLLKPVFRRPRPEVDPQWLDDVRRLVRARGWDPEYYCLVDRMSDVAYDYYTGDGSLPSNPPILAVDEGGRLQELSRLSEVIRAVAHRPRTAVNVYVPEECRGEVARQALSDG